MQLHTSRSAAAPVGHPSRTNLVCVDDATDAKLLQALRADGATVQILDNKPGLTRWDQLASCMFTLGDATGNDRHTTWDALAMGSIPVVKKKKTFKTLYDNSLLTPQGCVCGSHGAHNAVRASRAGTVEGRSSSFASLRRSPPPLSRRTWARWLVTRGTPMYLRCSPRGGSSSWAGGCRVCCTRCTTPAPTRRRSRSGRRHGLPPPCPRKWNVVCLWRAARNPCLRRA